MRWVVWEEHVTTGVCYFCVVNEDLQSFTLKLCWCNWHLWRTFKPNIWKRNNRSNAWGRLLEEPTDLAYRCQVPAYVWGCSQALGDTLDRSQLTFKPAAIAHVSLLYVSSDTQLPISLHTETLSTPDGVVAHCKWQHKLAQSTGTGAFKECFPTLRCIHSIFRLNEGSRFGICTPFIP